MNVSRLAGPLLNEIGDKLSAVRTVLLTALAVVVVWIVVRTMARTGAWVRALIVVLIGVVVLWAASNLDWLRDQLGSELKS